MCGFWTEADALAAIRDQVAHVDGAVVAGWSLVRVLAGADGEWQTVVEGQDLFALARTPGIAPA